MPSRRKSRRVAGPNIAAEDAQQPETATIIIVANNGGHDTQSESKPDPNAREGNNEDEANEPAAAGATTIDRTEDVIVTESIELTESAQLALPNTSTQRTKKTTTKVLRHTWKPDITILFLKYLQEARNDGRLKSDKNAFLKTIIASIIPQLKARFPSLALD